MIVMRSFVSRRYFLPIGFYCVLMIFVLWNVGVWALSGKGISYLSNLSASSVYIFYSLFLLSFFYSCFIFYLLVNLKRKGFLLAKSWCSFLGLFILILWLGGYGVLHYKYEIDVTLSLLSVGFVKKGVVSLSLILLGLFFKARSSSGDLID